MPGFRWASTKLRLPAKGFCFDKRIEQVVMPVFGDAFCSLLTIR